MIRNQAGGSSSVGIMRLKVTGLVSTHRPPSVRQPLPHFRPIVSAILIQYVLLCTCIAEDMSSSERPQLRTGTTSVIDIVLLGRTSFNLVSGRCVPFRCSTATLPPFMLTTIIIIMKLVYKVMNSLHHSLSVANANSKVNVLEVS